MQWKHISFAVAVLLLICGGAIAMWLLYPGPRPETNHVAPPIAQDKQPAHAPLELTPIYPAEPEVTPESQGPIQSETQMPPPIEFSSVERGTITGRVVDGGGVPLEDVRVFAIIESPGESANTDAEGRYSFKLEPGKWRLLIGTRGETRVLSQPGEAVVVASVETVASDFVLGAPVTVTIRLLDQSGIALTNKDPSGRWLHVIGTFTSPDGYTARKRATVDTEGLARFEDVPVDARELTVNAIGYMLSATIYLALRDSEINDAGEARLTALDVPVEPVRTGSVRGRIVDPDGKPLAGVSVFAHPSAAKERFGETFRSDDQTTTDAEGIYHFPALEVGKWYFIIASSEYTVKVNPGNVTIDEGAETVVAKDFVLGPPTRLKLRLLGAEGKPLKAGITISVVITSALTYDTHIELTAEDGAVTVDDVPAGDLKVKVKAPGHRDTEELELRSAEGQLTDGGDVQLVVGD